MKALIIDDEPAMRAVVAGILKEAGYETFEAADGRQGLAVFSEIQPDLVITDIVMPNEEGIGVIRQMRKLQSNLKIIAISGGGRGGKLDFLQIAKEFGAVATLAKPFRKQELLEIIKQIG
jgi:CheY-like chemotaxis protein